ncbi:TraG family conjugative transposon ATPase [Spirosoma luteum]|uniref:TraG family conjugative transposon ATPase n=1 Tax=Spirosoma luteum TaxID=431553 RepID=UPI00037439BD|nr:TraG family conjugative transposon ATPase [Spirosoma luteum]
MTYAVKELEKVFPLGAVEENCIFSKWGDLTLAFELVLPEIFTLNARIENGQELGDYRELVETWTKAIGVLPPGSVLHKQDWFVEETYRPNARELPENYLDRSSELHFNERPFLHHTCYLYITYSQGERTRTNVGLTSLLRSRIVPKRALSRSDIDKFMVAVLQLTSILVSSRLIKCRRLSNDELQPDKNAPVGQAGLIERYMTLSLNDKVVPLMDMDFTSEDELRIGGKYAKFFTISQVDDMPDSVNTNVRIGALSTENSNLSVGYATPIGLMLDCNHIYNQYVFIDDKTLITAELEKKAGNMVALSNFDRANSVNAVMVNNFLTMAAEKSLTPVRIHSNIQVWTEDKLRLPELRNKATASIAKMNLKPRENTRDAAFLFFAGIPGNSPDLPREDTFTQFAPQAACLFNHETNYYTSESAKNSIRVVDRLSGRPLWVDFSDEPMNRNWVTNRNKFIIGPSGSGKSFLTNHFLRSYYTHGAHVVIVDVGDSYRGLCGMLGGKYITYTMEKPIHFNPFNIEGRLFPDTEKAESLKNLLLTLWKSVEEKTNRSEYNALSAAVAGYFSKLHTDESIVPCFDTFYEFMQEDFKAYLKREGVKDDYFDFDNFMFNLKPYYKGGEFDFLLNSTENLDLLHERFIVFELDNVKDHPILFPIVTIIVMDTFISKMRKLEGIRKIILIEEAWKAIMTPSMAGYIKYLYKTVRKFAGEAWIVTQEINDIINNPIVQDSIVNNADCKILMDQRKYENKFTFVKELLGLTDKEKDLVLSMNRDNDPNRRYKEFFVSWGGQRYRVYGLEVSRPEYYAYTTEQKEKLRVTRKVRANGGNYDLAIKDVVAEDVIEQGVC